MAFTSPPYELAWETVGADLSRPLPIYRPFGQIDQADEQPNHTCRKGR